MEVRHKFNEQMAGIFQQILHMGALVEEALQKSLRAVQNHDLELALQVIEEDAKIDACQTVIEDMCTIVIATEQPVASDLRRIVTVIKVVSDLERIGDHARHLSKSVTNVGESMIAKVLPLLEQMTSLGISMVHDALTALTTGNVEEAQRVANTDQKMDELNRTLHAELITIMKESPHLIEEGTILIFVNRLLERLGDHVTNMCNWIVYAGKGRTQES